MDKDLQQDISDIKKTLKQHTELLDETAKTTLEILNQQDRMEQKVDRMEKTLQAVLDIVKTNDLDRKEIKSAVFDLDRRVIKLERKTA